MYVAVMLVAGCFYCAEPTEAAKKDLAALEGDWELVSGERDGQAIPEDIVKTGKRESKNGETTVTINGQLLMKAKYTVDPSKKPKAIDYDIVDGRAKGMKQLGIYEIDGDTVKFCFAGPDKDRPTGFAAKEGSGHTYSVWKKVKK